MTRFGYFLYSEVENNFFQEFEALKNEGCQSIFYDEYTSINDNYDSLNLLIKKCRPGDLLVLRSLDHICLSTKQLSYNINQLKEKECHLVVLEQESLNTIKFGLNSVYSFILDFCDYHSAFHSNCVLQRDRSYLNKKVYKGWTPEKVILVKNCFKLYSRGMTKNEIVNLEGLKLSTVQKYINLYTSGELNRIETYILNKEKTIKKPHGKPRGLSDKNKVIARKIKIMVSKKMSPKIIQDQLDISKTTYYRYKKLEMKELTN